MHEKIPALLLDKLNESLQFQEEKKKAHSQFDWKISKTDHVRLAANVFVCNLDRAKVTKLAKRLFLLKKKILFLTLVSSSRIFHELHPADGILVLDNERLALIGGYRERLERRETKPEEAAKREKHQKTNV